MKKQKTILSIIILSITILIIIFLSYSTLSLIQENQKTTIKNNIIQDTTQNITKKYITNNTKKEEYNCIYEKYKAIFSEKN